MGCGGSKQEVSPEDKALREEFNKMDVNHDGTVDISEVAKLYEEKYNDRKMYLEDEVRFLTVQFWKIMEIDRDARVSFDEFKKMRSTFEQAEKAWVEECAETRRKEEAAANPEL